MQGGVSYMYDTPFALCQLVLIVCLLPPSSGNMTCHWGSISNINGIYCSKEAFVGFSLFRVITSSRTGVQKAHSPQVSQLS